MTIVAIAYKYQEFCKLFYRIKNLYFCRKINDDLIKLMTISCTLSNKTDKAKLNNLCYNKVDFLISILNVYKI